MPISVNCPSCGKAYNVKDDAAGKRFRCKQCEAVIAIPEAPAPSEADGDPWDNLDLSTADDPYGDGETDEAPPPMPVRRRKKKKSSKSSPSGGMPICVWVAIGGEVLLILTNLLELGAGIWMKNASAGCGATFRILIEMAAILGYVQAQNSARWTAVVLSALGIVFSCGCAGLLTFGGDMLPPQVQQQFPPDAVIGVVVFSIVQGALRAAILAGLLVSSARDYFER
jgi:hypothetical protein